MRAVWRTAVMTACVAFAAGALGVYAGFAWFNESGVRSHGSLDGVVHRELHLTADQDSQITGIEARFAARKAELDEEMKSATRELAAAVAEGKAYTDGVERAVDRFHGAMGELQHETILHVFEMRAVLTPQQQGKFDEIVRAELLKSIDNAVVR